MLHARPTRRYSRILLRAFTCRAIQSFSLVGLLTLQTRSTLQASNPSAHVLDNDDCSLVLLASAEAAARFHGPAILNMSLPFDPLSRSVQFRFATLGTHGTISAGCSTPYAAVLCTPNMIRLPGSPSYSKFDSHSLMCLLLRLYVLLAVLNALLLSIHTLCIGGSSPPLLALHVRYGYSALQASAGLLHISE